MICLDSSAWIEIFCDGKHAQALAAALKDPAKLCLPSICLLEVHSYLAKHHGAAVADTCSSSMLSAQVIPLDGNLALSASRLRAKLNLPTADSIIYATAQSQGAVVWTLDNDFRGLENAKVF